MTEYEQAVFISYAWGGEREEIVNQIDQTLQKRGIKIIRDKRDLGYKGSISKFMERIGQGNCVILVISDKYLRSPNCMFELVEIAENKNLIDRIFPIVLSDADIYKPKNQIQYIKYWETELKDLKESLGGVDPTHLEGIYEQLNLYDRIRDNISRLTAILSDMNTLTPDMHKDSEFNEIYDSIEKQLKESAAPQTKSPNLGTTIRIEYFEPETILVPEGSFWMGKDSETSGHEVSLPAYRIGKYPVTIAQYAEFISQNKQKLVSPSMGWDGQRPPRDKENYPVTGVTWYDALDYCNWLSEKTGRSYTLPNEAQWEKACRGGNCYFFPWGDEFDSKRCNHGKPDLAPVDAYPAQSEYGFDFVGNVRQWTCTLWGEDRFTPDSRYPYNKWREDGRNNLEASRQIRRVMRGGTMNDDIKSLRCSARSGHLPKDSVQSDMHYGFRVAMSVSPLKE